MKKKSKVLKHNCTRDQSTKDNIYPCFKFFYGSCKLWTEFDFRGGYSLHYIKIKIRTYLKMQNKSFFIYFFKGGSRQKNWCMARALSVFIRYFSNYYTLHRSDLAARAAPLDPRACFLFYLNIERKVCVHKFSGFLIYFWIRFWKI